MPDFVPVAADQLHMRLTCVWKGALIDKAITERIVLTPPSFLYAVEFWSSQYGADGQLVISQLAAIGATPIPAICVTGRHRVDPLGLRSICRRHNA